MPSIDDPTDYDQCGRARAYFGFAENFINDDAVCEDVEQLKHVKDFDFLQELFGQGVPSAPSPTNAPVFVPTEAPEVEPFVLGEVNDGEFVLTEGIMELVRLLTQFTLFST